MPLNLPLVVHAILEEYALSPDGDHGVAHWARVLENGLRLANVTGADIEVVQLFAVFHDSKRVKETSDPDHGRFGAEFADKLRGQMFDLPDHEKFLGFVRYNKNLGNIGNLKTSKHCLLKK